MKIFVKLMALLVVLAVAGPFFLKGPDGRPLLSLRDLKLPSFSMPQLPGEQSTSSETPELPSGPNATISWSKDDSMQRETYRYDSSKPVTEQANVFYRWKDQNGVWQFSKTPHPTEENFIVSVDPNGNILQSLAAEKIDKVFGRNQPDPNAPEEGDEKGEPSAVPSTIPFEDIPKLIEQAKELQKLSEQRQKIMDNL